MLGQERFTGVSRKSGPLGYFFHKCFDKSAWQKSRTGCIFDQMSSRHSSMVAVGFVDAMLFSASPPRTGLWSFRPQEETWCSFGCWDLGAPRWRGKQIMILIYINVNVLQQLSWYQTLTFQCSEAYIVYRIFAPWFHRFALRRDQDGQGPVVGDQTYLACVAMIISAHGFAEACRICATFAGAVSTGGFTWIITSTLSVAGQHLIISIPGIWDVSRGACLKGQKYGSEVCYIGPRSGFWLFVPLYLSGGF